VVRGGLYHPKIRLFQDENNDVIVAHGSNNMTNAGTLKNYEQIIISTSWEGDYQKEIINRYEIEFNKLWEGNTSEAIRVFDFPDAISKNLIRNYSKGRKPSLDDYFEAAVLENNITISSKTEVKTLKRHKFVVPPFLDYRSGDFEHQGRALKALETYDYCGILQMATGSGKTIVSLIAANKIYNRKKPLLIIISAPYIPLINQWAEETIKFGLNPIKPGEENSKSAKIEKLRFALRNLRYKTTDVETLVITHNFLVDPAFSSILGEYDTNRLLIADEVHNLGNGKFLSLSKELFEYRIGLSATPIRQYDEIGTDQLIEFFGDIIFKFPLKEAINRCLVPYDYYVHPTRLTSYETDEWLKLTNRLKKIGWISGNKQEGTYQITDSVILALLNRRRKLLEQAEGKLNILRSVLSHKDRAKIKHTLIYASDKGREQLEKVNRILMDDLDLKIHQITQEETRDPELVKVLLYKFAEGKIIQVLTAMRVLDEGVNIPEITTAFILASTTVERQWVQRRGRILRKSKSINKRKAVLHDFLVLPPENYSNDTNDDLIIIVKNELDRILEFAKLSANVASDDGAIISLKSILNRYF